MGVSKQKNLKKGNDPGAPEHPFIKKKILYTSLFSLVIWFIVFLILKKIG